MTEGYSEYYDSSVLKKVREDQIVDGTFIIPNNIRKIGRKAFAKSKKLEKIIIPNSVEKIGSYAFEDCHNLSEVVMSKGIKKIGFFAFAKCYSLRYLTIPDSLRILDNTAFAQSYENLNLVIKTSLFKIVNWENESKSYFGINAKTIKIFDSISTYPYINIDSLKLIRKRELKFRLENILKEKNINIKDFYKQNKDYDDFFDSIANKFDSMDDDYDYKLDLQKYIDDYLSKNSIVVKVFEVRNIFEGQTRKQIYDFINEYNPENINSKDINELRNYSKALEYYPTYISGEFLKILTKKITFNSEIKQIIKFLNSVSKSVNGNNILKKIFFKRENENSNELSFDTEMLNKIVSFIQNELNELESEIELFNYLKQIIALYIEKRQKQINRLNNSLDEVEVIEIEDSNKQVMNSSNNLLRSTTINSEINKLNKSVELILGQFQDINTLLAFNIAVSNELTSLLKDLLPNLIAKVALDNGINQRKDILEDITTIKNVLNAMILGDNKTKITNNSVVLELKTQVDEMIKDQKVKINKN